jgi:hypothetical protein
MSVSHYERFLGNDWERYANFASKTTCLSCGATALLCIVLGCDMLQIVLAIIAGLIMSIWEFPFIYAVVPQVCGRFRHVARCALSLLSLAASSIAAFCIATSSNAPPPLLVYRCLQLFLLGNFAVSLSGSCSNSSLLILAVNSVAASSFCYLYSIAAFYTAATAALLSLPLASIVAFSLPASILFYAQ